MSDLTLTDLYCGVGGSSTGAVQVPGVRLSMAANHWDLAVRIHSENHPTSEHDCADLSQVEPARYPYTDILWASPECTNHSIAKGKKAYDPAAERSRSTMFDVLRFAEHHRYDAVIVENVVDVVRWVLFPAWRQGFEDLGYELTIVYANAMFAWATGPAAPQDRNRVFILATRKGARKPDVAKWLSPPAYCKRCTHEVKAVQSWKRPGEPWGVYRRQYNYCCPLCSDQVEPLYLPASSVIDWTTPGTRIGDRAKPLADKTMRRIIDGVRTYGPDWLLVPLEGRNGKQAASTRRPMRTQTTRAETGLLSPPSFVVELRGGGSKHRSVDRALSTVTASGNHHLLVSYYGTRGLSPVSEPLSTVTTRDRHALVALPDLSDPVALEAFVADCHFRMLQPAEIQAAMALPADYVLGDDISKRNKVKLLGNGVCPPVARDLVYAVREALTGENDIVPDVWEQRAAA